MTLLKCPFCKNVFNSGGRKVNIIGGDHGLRIITVNVPIRELKQLEALVEKIPLASRSEAIRRAISDWIEKQIRLENDRDDLEKYYNNKVIEVLKNQ